MSLFSDKISYWNEEYNYYSSDVYNGESITYGPIFYMEQIDSYLSSNDTGDEIDLAGLYINILLRPRTSFLVLAEIDSDKSIDIDSVISSKQIIDIVSPLYRQFDIEEYLEKYLDSDRESGLKDILDEVESEVVDNMDLDDIKEVLGRIASFFETEGSIKDKVQSSGTKSSLLDYRAAIVFLDEKGFESVAARIESENKENDNPLISIEYIINTIIESLQELEEKGHNIYEYA